uniref:Uncharacterized protein n=1 Tax=Spongospora subterranea TaxID=70186 RepID=A0A0H5RCE5_9EUKA|eukprot:CRZ11421.1 hypothetical protein [Spongospora subterranea]
MTSNIAACVARLAAELASDSLQTSCVSPTSRFQSWRPFSGRSRSDAATSYNSSLSVERRLQRFTTLEDFRLAILEASVQEVRQVQEVAVSMMLSKALCLGESITFRESVAQCVVVLLSRADSRFINDAVNRMIDSLSGNNIMSSAALSTATLCTTLETISHIAIAFPSHMFHFQPLIFKSVRKLMKSAEVNVRVDALRCLARVLSADDPLPDLAKFLTKTISDKSPEVRSAVAECALCTSNPISLLVQLLEDVDCDVRRSSSLCFKKINIPADSIISKLSPCQRICSSKDSKAKAACINAIVYVFNNLKDLTGNSLTIIAADIMLQLISPSDSSTSLAASTVVIRGLLMVSDTPGRSSIIAAIVALGSRKDVSPWLLSSCLDVLFSGVSLLGAEISVELEDALLELLLSALSNSMSRIRVQAVSTLQELARNIPSQTTTILRIVQNVAAIHIAEVTVSCGDTKDMALAMIAMHGHCHAMAALVSIANELDAGIPDIILGELFKTSTSLAALYTGDIKSNPQLFMSISECSWVMVNSLLSQGVTSTQLFQTLFPLWKTYMKADRVASNFSESVSIASQNSEASPFLFGAAIHVRRWALVAIGTLIRCSDIANLTDDEAGILKPIFALVNEAMIIAESVKACRDPVSDDAFVKGEFIAYKAVLVDIFSVLPVGIFHFRHIPLLHLCVSEFTYRTAPMTGLFDSILSKSDYVLSSEVEIGSKDYAPPPSVETFCSFSSDDAVWTTRFEPHVDAPVQSAAHRFASCNISQRVVDASIRSFALIFKLQQQTHQVQLLSHFSSIHAQSIDYEEVPVPVFNIAAALLLTISNMNSCHQGLGESPVRESLFVLLESLAASPASLVRRASCEAFGLLCRLEGAQFTMSMLERQRDILQANNQQSVFKVTGAIFLLANIHRHVGIIGTISFLPFTIMALQSLFDHTVEPLRTFVLHSLWCLVDISGTNFSPYARSSLDLMLLQTLTDPAVFSAPVIRITARLVRSFLEILGPELRVDPAPLRKCEWLWRQCIKAALPEAVEGIQQFIFFSLSSVQTLKLFPILKSCVAAQTDPSLLVSLVTCLTQICMKDSALMVEHNIDGDLFNLLEWEADPVLQRKISTALQTLVAVSSSSYSDRWIDRAREVIVNSRFSPVESNVVDDAGAGTDTAAHHLSWKTTSCFTQCIATLIELSVGSSSVESVDDSSAVVVKRVRELVNLACRAACAGQDSIRIPGLRALTSLIRHFSNVPDPISGTERLLQLDVSQMKAAIRSALMPESSPSLNQVTCEACCELLISGLMDFDASAFKKFVDALYNPIVDLGNQLSLICSRGATFRVLLSHLLALSRLAVHRPTVFDVTPGMVIRLSEQLINALQDRIRICGTTDLKFQNSLLFPEMVLSRHIYDSEWPVILRGLSSISSEPGVDSTRVIRVVSGAVMQYMHTFLGAGIYGSTEHEPEQIACWCVQSLASVWNRKAVSDLPLQFTVSVVSSLSIIADTTACGLGLLPDIVAAVASITSSLKHVKATQQPPSDDDRTISTIISQIVAVSVRRCLVDPGANEVALKKCFEISVLLTDNSSLLEISTFALLTGTAMRALSCFNQLEIMVSALSSLRSLISSCVLNRSAEHLECVDAIFIDVCRLLRSCRCTDVGLTTDGQWISPLCEAFALSLISNPQRYAVAAFLIQDYLGMPVDNVQHMIGLRMVESILKYASNNIDAIMPLLLTIAPILFSKTIESSIPNSLTIATALAVIIEKQTTNSSQSGVFLASVVIPIFTKSAAPVIASLVTLLASVVSDSFRLAVQSLSVVDRTKFQQSVEQATLQSKAQIADCLSPPVVAVKKPAKKSKTGRRKKQIVETGFNAQFAEFDQSEFTE